MNWANAVPLNVSSSVSSSSFVYNDHLLVVSINRMVNPIDIICMYIYSCKKYGQIFHAHIFCFNLRPLEPASLPTNPTGREVLLRST
jgi:hypothetical protein